MSVKVAINGFGRIGRLVLRAIYESGRTDVEVVAINDLADLATNAHLLKYDSVHGRFPGTVETTDGKLVVNGHAIAVVQERDPTKLPWKALGVQVAMECSGIFTKRADAAKHLEAGAEKVLISAPATDEDITVVYGVNSDQLTAEHRIVSNASCTTNCLAPVAFVLNNLVGIDKGFMTTIHSYTGDQRVVDTMHKDLHRARAAALNMIPTSTGAAKAVGKVLPELKGKLDGTAIRVPTPNVSVVDFKFVARRATTVEEIRDAMKAAAEGPLKGILGVYDEPLVSGDFNHDDHSSIFALNEIKVIDGTFVRVMSWYDNEWGFSCRMSDTAVAMAAARNAQGHDAMSKTIMWAETDTRGFVSECLFNEDSRTFEVVVSGPVPRLSRAASFPVQAEPVWGMGDADHERSVRIARTLVEEVDGTLTRH